MSSVGYPDIAARVNCHIRGIIEYPTIAAGAGRATQLKQGSTAGIVFDHPLPPGVHYPEIAAAIDCQHRVVAADSELTEVAATTVELLQPAVIAIHHPDISPWVQRDPNRAIARELARAATRVARA